MLSDDRPQIGIKVRPRFASGFQSRILAEAFVFLEHWAAASLGVPCLSAVAQLIAVSPSQVLDYLGSCWAAYATCDAALQNLIGDEVSR